MDETFFNILEAVIKLRELIVLDSEEGDTYSCANYCGESCHFYGRGHCGLFNLDLDRDRFDLFNERCQFCHYLKPKKG